MKLEKIIKGAIIVFGVYTIYKLSNGEYKEMLEERRNERESERYLKAIRELYFEVIDS